MHTLTALSFISVLSLQVTVPFGAVNPVTALVPFREAYPVPESYVQVRDHFLTACLRVYWCACCVMALARL